MVRHGTRADLWCTYSPSFPLIAVPSTESCLSVCGLYFAMFQRNLSIRVELSGVVNRLKMRRSSLFMCKKQRFII